MKRRPSLSLVIALLALFVALGGPAHASRFVKATIGSADVKDRSLKARDLTPRTVRQLRTPRDGSVTEVKIANGAITPRKIAPGAVGTAALADRSIGAADLAVGSVTGTQIADGSLAGSDLGRFSGRFRLAQPIVVPHGTCWSGVPANLPPERARADISQDLVLVTPDSSWPEQTLTFMVKVEPPTPKPGRFTLAACNPTNADSVAFTPSFRYLIIRLP